MEISSGSSFLYVAQSLKLYQHEQIRNVEEFLKNSKHVGSNLWKKWLEEITAQSYSEDLHRYGRNSKGTSILESVETKHRR